MWCGSPHVPQRTPRTFGLPLLVLGLFLIVAVLMAFTEYREQMERAAVSQALADLSVGLVVELNGREVDDPTPIIANLKRAQPDRFNHAPGENPQWYRIEIKNAEHSLVVLLAGDQRVADKYWVFLPDSRKGLGGRGGSFVAPELSAILANYGPGIPRRSLSR